MKLTLSALPSLLLATTALAQIQPTDTTTTTPPQSRIQVNGRTHTIPVTIGNPYIHRFGTDTDPFTHVRILHSDLGDLKCFLWSEYDAPPLYAPADRAWYRWAFVTPVFRQGEPAIDVGSVRYTTVGCYANADEPRAAVLALEMEDLSRSAGLAVTNRERMARGLPPLSAEWDRPTNRIVLVVVPLDADGRGQVLVGAGDRSALRKAAMLESAEKTLTGCFLYGETRVLHDGAVHMKNRIMGPREGEEDSYLYGVRCRRASVRSGRGRSG